MIIRYSPPPPEAKRLEPWFEDEEEEGGPETNHSYLRRTQMISEGRVEIIDRKRGSSRTGRARLSLTRSC